MLQKRHEKRSADFLSAPEEVARALKEKFDVILVVTSSYVEGEPPDNILELFLAICHYEACSHVSLKLAQATAAAAPPHLIRALQALSHTSGCPFLPDL